MHYVFDIEADGLLPTVSRLWVVAFRNLANGERTYFLEGDLGWRDVMNNAKTLIGHNVIGYDFPVLEKLTGYVLPDHVKVHDTLIMSRVYNFERPGGHSLSAWGEFLGERKHDFNDFSRYSDEMLEYCLQDLFVNTLVYHYLIKELGTVIEKHPILATYLRVEHAVGKWFSKAELYGWPFDYEAALELRDRMQEEVNEAVRELEPQLGLKAVAVDMVKGEVTPKAPAWTKAGTYALRTANWFGIPPEDGLRRKPIKGAYCRVTFEPLKLSSVADVKTFLFRNGWEPTEYNYKRTENGGFEKRSPKITEDSLEFLNSEAGAMYARYKSTSAHLSKVLTWIEQAKRDADGVYRVHGTARPIGTPSMRTVHQIIVNLPDGEKPWGKEMRQLFRSLEGWSVIGADSSGNQARGLAHFLKNDEFTEQLLHGDIHQENADRLTKILREVLKIDHEVPRGVAKRILFAFLFGASGDKLWSYIFGSTNSGSKGKKLKDEFTKSVPGFERLIKSLNTQYDRSRDGRFGWIRSLAGNKIFVDSKHKLLVYLLQAVEKATCGAAVMLTAQQLEKEGIPYQPLNMYHDEENFMVPDEFAERASEIAQQAFHDGPEIFGVHIMEGKAKIGKNWYDVH